MKTFNLFQLGLAISATEAQRAGFPHVAAAFAKALRRELGVEEDATEASKRLGSSQTAGNRHCYGRFSLNEADECAMENVEFPTRTLP